MDSDLRQRQEEQRKTNESFSSREAIEQVSFHRSHGRHIDDEMDMTALIDVTFLLLIFFIVTSKLANEVKQPLPIAKNGQAVPTDKAIILTVRGGETAIVTRADGSPFSDVPDQQAAEIEEYIQIGFNSKKTDILIRADGSVRNGDINRIKEIVSESLEDGQLIGFAVKHEQ